MTIRTYLGRFLTTTQAKTSVGGVSPRPFLLLPKFNRFTIHETRVLPFQVVCHYYSGTAVLSPDEPIDSNADILIVGSGATGLTAALCAREKGLSALVIEKTSLIGGTTAYSGGGLWVPENHLHRSQGVQDSLEDALKYMESIIGDVGPTSSLARKLAYLQNGPRMVKFLEQIGFRWRCSLQYTDYYPDAPGGTTIGRTIEPAIFDDRKLGIWRKRLRRPPVWRPPFYTNEGSTALLFRATLAGALKMAQILTRWIGRKLMGQTPLTMGQSLAAQLLYLNIKRKTRILTDTALVRLITNDNSGDVKGAIVNWAGKEIHVRAKKGVLLAAGGFAQNIAMREKYQPQPSSTQWTSAPEGDTGDGILAGIQVNAATALMDDAWWGPTMIEPVSGGRTFCLFERSRPHSIIVDSAGQRFMNEAESYIDAVHKQYRRHESVNAIPAWMIIDSQYRAKYNINSIMPGASVKASLASGFLTEAPSMTELATKIGIDAQGLIRTAARFNDMSRRGVDEDYGRGGNAYDRQFGDPSCRPNPNLGSIKKAPFYAIKIYPGDLGTKGGLLTNENAQVLDKNGAPIKGLYAAGNNSSSIMGRTYAGAGATLGPAMTFGFLAAEHMTRTKGE